MEIVKALPGSLMIYPVCRPFVSPLWELGKTAPNGRKHCPSLWYCLLVSWEEASCCTISRSCRHPSDHDSRRWLNRVEHLLSSRNKPSLTPGMDHDEALPFVVRHVNPGNIITLPDLLACVARGYPSPHEVDNVSSLFPEIKKIQYNEHEMFCENRNFMGA